MTKKIQPLKRDVRCEILAMCYALGLSVSFKRFVVDFSLIFDTLALLAVFIFAIVVCCVFVLRNKISS